MRADKLIAASGMGSRKEIKELFRKKRVMVDGKIMTDPSIHVDPEKSCVEVDGKKIGYKPYIYLMMNKPAGYISATEDDYTQTVIDLLPQEYMHYAPSPVGRLDKDTEGLLLLTNDGELAHRLLSPKKLVPKVYQAVVAHGVSENDILAFRKGIYIKEDDFTTMPGDLKVVKDDTHPLCEVKIFEGKFHQVKRMFEKTGNKVLYLERVCFAGLELDKNLKRGEFRELNLKEEQKIKSIGDMKNEKS
ncbi:MAG: pseudouridine synthase [Bacillota bacterium]|nr:pseudouridine synthase [Bacillota bacterium]